MDFYKNEDYFRRVDWFRLGQPTVAAESLSYTVVQDLQTEPIDLSFFKNHARIDFNTDDNLCLTYIKAARQFLEGWTQLSFGEKKIRFMALKVPDKWDLMYGPYVSIETVGTDFRLFGNTLMRNGSSRFHYNTPLYDVDIELKTGWDNLPDAIKIAICNQACWMYENRTSFVLSDQGVPHKVDEIDNQAKVLLKPFRNITWP